MQPVRIKYLGLISMTRRGYITALACAAVVAVACLAVAWFLERLPPIYTVWKNTPVPPRPTFAYFFFNNLYRIILICIALQCFDTWLVLRRFTRKEKEQQAQPDIKP